MTHIRKITDDDIKAMAREAAEQGAALADANHFTPLSEGWMAFNLAFREREAEMRAAGLEMTEAA